MNTISLSRKTAVGQQAVTGDERGLVGGEPDHRIAAAQSVGTEASGEIAQHFDDIGIGLRPGVGQLAENFENLTRQCVMRADDPHVGREVSEGSVKWGLGAAETWGRAARHGRRRCGR